MSRITPSVAARRLDFRFDEITHCLGKLAEPDAKADLLIDSIVGNAQAAWSIALRIPRDVVAELLFRAHQDDDPNCTCNDCMASFIESVG